MLHNSQDIERIKLITFETKNMKTLIALHIFESSHETERRGKIRHILVYFPGVTEGCPHTINVLALRHSEERVDHPG